MYKKAVSIVPDIEARTFVYTQSNQNQLAETSMKGLKIVLFKVLVKKHHSSLI